MKILINYFKNIYYLIHFSFIFFSLMYLCHFDLEVEPSKPYSYSLTFFVYFVPILLKFH